MIIRIINKFIRIFYRTRINNIFLFIRELLWITKNKIIIIVVLYNFRPEFYI